MQGSKQATSFPVSKWNRLYVRLGTILTRSGAFTGRNMESFELDQGEENRRGRIKSVATHLAMTALEAQQLSR